MTIDPILDQSGKLSAVLIKEVRKGSPAEAAGIKSGMRIMIVQDISVAGMTMEDFKSHFLKGISMKEAGAVFRLGIVDKAGTTPREIKIPLTNSPALENKQLATATQAGVDTASTPPDGNRGKPYAAELLKNAKSLYDQGQISKEVYDRKVKEVMDSL
jgi:hypothetical protein